MEIKVLNEFLETYKKNCFNYYTNIANKHIDLKFKEFEITRAEVEKIEKRMYNKETRQETYIKAYSDAEIESILKGEHWNMNNVKAEIKYMYIKQFNEDHMLGVLNLVNKIIDYDIIDIELLNKILDKDVKSRKENFISKVEKVVGDILDISDLSFGDTGELNGIVKGDICNAKVETISAGGYAVQCYHYRVLVKKIK